MCNHSVCLLSACVWTYMFLGLHTVCVARACLCLDLYLNQVLMLLPSAGRALPSHYTGSRTNHRLCVSVSPNLSLFSLLSLVIFLFHSLRQLPSPPGPQSTLITFSSRMYSISLALLSISLLSFSFFFLSSYLSHSSVLLPPLLSPLILSGLHLADCTLFHAVCIFFYPLS